MKRLGIALLIIIVLVALLALHIYRGRREVARPSAAPISETLGGVTVYTVQVAGKGTRPQGETEIAADQSGHVAAVWMNGSPLNLLNMTFNAAYSTNGGMTFSAPSPVATEQLADPAIGIGEDGTLFLSGLHKQSTRWTDIGVDLFRSTNWGKTWAKAATVASGSGVFNDRDWLTTDATGRIHIIYSPRVPGANGIYERQAYYTYSTDGGKTFAPRILINASPIPGIAGVSSRGLGVDPSGTVFVAAQAGASLASNPGRTANAAGDSGYLYVGTVGGTSFKGPYEFTTAAIHIAPAKDQDEGADTEQDPTGPTEGLTDKRGLFTTTEPYPRMKIATDASGTNAYVVWVGDSATTEGVYMSRLRPGATSVDAPHALATGTLGHYRLPIIAIDAAGGLHAFWVGETGDDAWALFYAHSSDKGASWSAPEQVSPFTYPMDIWPGDFMGATIAGKDAYVAWSVPSGEHTGIYVSKLVGVAK